MFDAFGFSQYAASNDIIMIFPQARSILLSPSPCFDFSGYTTIETDKHLTTENPQLKAMKAMIERVLEPRDSEEYNYTAANINNYNWFESLMFNLWRVLINLENYHFQIWKSLFGM